MISSGGGAVEPLPHPRVAAVLEYTKEPRKTGQTKEEKINNHSRGGPMH